MRLDIAISMNRRILTKYSKNLDLDSGLIGENRTLGFLNRNLRFYILEHFQNVIIFSSEL
jgi:hypothetical protein